MDNGTRSLTPIPAETGVYIIECLGNDRVYVGSGKDMLFRSQSHLRDLRRNWHSNVKLQRAFNKYGEASLVFYVLERTRLEDLRAIEHYWIVALDAVRRGFNIAYDTIAPTQGRKASIPTRLLLSLVRLGRPKSAEWKRWRSLAWRGSGSPNYKGAQLTPERMKKLSELARGRIVSDEIRARISASKMGHKVSKATRLKISKSRTGKQVGDSHHFWGKHHSRESRDKISATKLSSPWYNNQGKLTENDVLEIRAVYPGGNYSSRQLGRKYHVSKTTILNVVKNYVWSHLLSTPNPSLQSQT